MARAKKEAEGATATPAAPAATVEAVDLPPDPQSTEGLPPETPAESPSDGNACPVHVRALRATVYRRRLVAMGALFEPEAGDLSALVAAGVVADPA